VGNAMAAGGTQIDLSAAYVPPMKSSVPGTATTFVFPSAGAAVLWNCTASLRDRRLVYSPLAAELWDVYADEFKARWGMDREVAAIIGARSKSLFSAEFKENGVDSYRTSVVLPIRNAFYAASQMDAPLGDPEEYEP